MAIRKKAWKMDQSHILCYTAIRTYWIAINHIQIKRKNSTEHGTYLRNKIDELGTPPKGGQEQQIHAGSRKSWAWMDTASIECHHQSASMLYHCAPSQKKKKTKKNTDLNNAYFYGLRRLRYMGDEI